VENARQALEECRLAGAIGTDQAKDFARAYVERHIIEGQKMTVALLDMAHLEYGRRVSCHRKNDCES
jgi:hypothetical protein